MDRLWHNGVMRLRRTSTSSGDAGDAADETARTSAPPGTLAVAASPLLRALYAVAGFVFLIVGAVGLVVPVLPTTPFVLLAAACFLRRSGRLHAWLLGTRLFGPLIVEWEQHRSIPWRTKIVAIVLMTATFCASIVFFVRPPWLKVVLGIVCAGLAVWLYRVPSRDRPLAVKGKS
jgi:uncharacterized membrane protein YbaN (DUF454 family)